MTEDLDGNEMGEFDENEDGDTGELLPDLEPLRELELETNARLSRWHDLLQIPNNVCGWRKDYRNPEKSDITRVQCDPVQAHQDIFGLTEEYKDKEAFKPFEQNTKKVCVIGTYGAIYSATIQMDRNAEDRHTEMMDHMTEFIHQVREELHVMRAELAETKMEISAIMGALVEEGDEEETEHVETAQRGLSQASNVRRQSSSQHPPRQTRLSSKLSHHDKVQEVKVAKEVIPVSVLSSRQPPPKPSVSNDTQNDEIKKYEEQVKNQLLELEPTRRMTKDTNYQSAMEQCHGNMDAEAKVKSEYMKYFQQEYDYYYTFYQDQLQKIKSGNPIDSTAPTPQPAAPTPQPVAPIPQPVIQSAAPTPQPVIEPAATPENLVAEEPDQIEDEPNLVEDEPNLVEDTPEPDMNDDIVSIEVSKDTSNEEVEEATEEEQGLDAQ